jgi:hypothetical protein
MHKTLLSWRAVLTLGPLAALAACGGGVVLLLGFIGSAGGDWLQDDQPNQAGLQLRSTCLADPQPEPAPVTPVTEDCRINIQPVGGQDLYASAFDLSFTSNLPGCLASGSGRAEAERLTLSGCFTGAYVNINQAVSDDGQIRMFFNFTPTLNQGVWVELHQGQRRFVFNNDANDVVVNGVTYQNSTGCELGTPQKSIDVSLSKSNIRNATGPFETTIDSFVIQGAGGPWQGRFVGVSGMRLTRGTEVLELQRQQGTGTC